MSERSLRRPAPAAPLDGLWSGFWCAPVSAPRRCLSRWRLRQLPASCCWLPWGCLCEIGVRSGRERGGVLHASLSFREAARPRRTQCSAGFGGVGGNRVSRAPRNPIAVPMKCAARRSSLRCPAGARDRGGLVRFIAPKARPPAPGKRAEEERQPALDLEPDQQPLLPSLESVGKPPASKAEAINQEALEKKA